MIEIKILYPNNYREMGDNIPQFIEALNKVLGYKVEILHKPIESYNGYYLMPNSGLPYQMLNDEFKIGNVFLLSVINSDMPDYLEYFKPVGLTDWFSFKKGNNSAIISKKLVSKFNLEAGFLGSRSEHYCYHILQESDGTYETVAKSILKYLELYDVLKKTN